MFFLMSADIVMLEHMYAYTSPPKWDALTEGGSPGILLASVILVCMLLS